MKKYILVLFCMSCGQQDQSPLAAASGVATQTSDNRGEKGDKGDKGDTGSMGDNGKSGTSGQAGTNGTNGVSGIDAHKVKVYDGSSSLIGELYGVNNSTNEFYVVNGAMRFQFTRANGVFPNAYIVYANAGCSGASRVVITNGQFANTFIDGRDNTTIVKAKGLNLGNFNYQSRLAASTSCANTSGSATATWAYDTNPTLGFAYPVVNADIDNE